MFISKKKTDLIHHVLKNKSFQKYFVYTLSMNLKMLEGVEFENVEFEGC